MRVDKKLERALIYISSDKTHAFVVESVYVIRGENVVFRTQGGQWPNPVERAPLSILSAVLDQHPDEVKRRIRGCNAALSPEPTPQARLASKRASQERLQKLMALLKTWEKPKHQ